MDGVGSLSLVLLAYHSVFRILESSENGTSINITIHREEKRVVLVDDESFWQEWIGSTWALQVWDHATSWAHQSVEAMIFP